MSTGTAADRDPGGAGGGGWALSPAVEPARSEAAASGDRARGAIAIWLLACAALVFAMVVLGGVTRLSGSGLSMTDWRPVTGIVPPLGDAAWDEEFARYRASPEFRHVNHWMTVADFKRIYWFEYAHRVLGRLIGVAFLLPFLWFLARGRIDRTLAPRLAALFVLGALQGLLGWYMVKSGLVKDPRVSQYRLTAHLLLAVGIYAYMLWIALRLLRPIRAGAPRAPVWLPRAALGLGALVVATLISGGFVAGLKAGFVYNTFPTMGGAWIPPEVLALEPWWINPFENPVTAQLVHRVLALVTFAIVLAFWIRAHRAAPTPAARAWTHAVAVAACLQIALGIATLLARVPLPLAAAHQAGALVLLTCLVGLNAELRRRA